jgi:peptidoglycan/xylan/chitin deacetylase (PgdA/CDA1 family)
MHVFSTFFLKGLIKASDQRLIIPFYHLVTDSENTFANSLYTPRKIIDFKKDLDLLTSYYTPLLLEEFIALSKSGKKVHKNSFHLTFDDGLSNFYNVVAPILLKKKIPATVFINTDFVDNKDLFYRYKASLLYQNYQKSSPEVKRKFYDFFEEKGTVEKKIFEINYNNKSVLDNLAKIVGFDFKEFLKEKQPYLSSMQIQELIDMGFTIGSHSKNHPLYTDIDFEEQIRQTKESIDWVVGKFNIDYKVFSFPHTDLGVSKKFFMTLAEECKIDASFGTAGIKKDELKTNFQRLFFEIGSQSAERHLIIEYFKYFLKIPFLKNTMPRN